MRFVSFVVAIIVAVALYAVVLERDRLLAFSRGGAPDEPAAQAVAEETPAPEKNQPAAVEHHRVAVVVLESSANTVDNTVVLRGQTEAAREVNVRAQTAGLMISEPLRKGNFVKAGDVLCQIDPGTREAQLSEAEARLAEATISNTAAVKLFEGGFGSDTRSAGAKASLQAAQAAVDFANTEIDRLTIKAPFDGLLETDTAELGSLLQTGASCATVIQLDPIKLVGFLPETSVNNVKIGAEAVARLASGRDVAGIVTFLSRSADPNTRTFKVEMTVPNADLSIRDGQSADIGISADGVPAHTIPASALTLDNSGTMGVRVVDSEDITRFIPVNVIRDTLNGVFVTGLPETARVIVVGQEFVTDGVAVDVTVQGNDT